MAKTVNLSPKHLPIIAALEAQGIPYTNHFYFLGYNPPYEVLNRKNEVIVELERP